MNWSRLEEACGSLPIFPLGDAVLLPGALLPLHVFEPRYRTLVTDVMAGDGLMGVATVREPTSEGSDPFLPVMGVGRIAAHHLHDGGRSHIILEHVGTVRALEELESDKPYRRVRAERLLWPSDPVPADAVLALKALMWQLAALHPTAFEAAESLTRLGPEAFVDGLAQRVLAVVEQRVDYLCALNWSERIAVLDDALAGYLSIAAPAIEA